MSAKKEPVVITCSVCGTSKSHRPSSAKQRSGKYCSRRCSILDRPSKRNLIKRNCAHCNSEFESWPSEARKYCSKACHVAANPSTFNWSEWRANNVTRRLEREKEYRARNRAAINKANREWARRNPEKVKALAVVRRAAARDAHGLPEAIARMMADANGHCFYCGQKSDRLEVDHVMPVSRGGTSAADNLVASCRACNASKGAKTLDEWATTRDYEVRRAVAQAMGIEVTEV